MMGNKINNSGNNAGSGVNPFANKAADKPLFQYSADLKFTDAFKFAEGHIAENDTNKDGSLDKLELRQNIFAGDDEQAAQFLEVLDQNHDQKIDTLENAAYVMYQDDSSNQLSGTIKAFAEQVKNPVLKDLLNLAADVLTLISPSKLDGTVTQGEADLAEASVLNLGTEVSETLNGIINTKVEDRNGKKMSLADRYTEYQADKKKPDAKVS